MRFLIYLTNSKNEKIIKLELIPILMCFVLKFCGDKRDCLQSKQKIINGHIFVIKRIITLLTNILTKI